MEKYWKSPEEKEDNSLFNHIAIMCGIFGATSLVAYAVSLKLISSEATIMLYLLCVFLVVWRTGRFSLGVVASIGSTMVYYYFFASPKFSYDMTTPPRYLLTMGIMISVALVTSGLISQIRQEALIAREKEALTEQLLRLNNDLAGAKSAEAIIGIALSAINEGVGCAAGYVAYDPDGKPGSRYVFQTMGHHTALTWYPMEEDEDVRHRIRNGKTIFGLMGAIRIRLAEQENLDRMQLHLMRSIIDNIGMALDRFRTAELRLQAREEATQERFRSTLLRSISHDIRTPLTSISGNAEMLMKASKPEDHRYRMAKNIYDDAQNLSGMVENVLGITRLESGVEIKKEVEVAEEVIGAAVQLTEVHHPEYDIQVSVPEEILMVPMDASLIQQAITNMLENAIHHTKKKDGVAVILERQGNDAVFTVRDRGMGINPEHLDRLFEPFYQTNRSDRVVYRGFGLGLSICHSIVKAHGGRILARNRKDMSGAEIIFTLPMEGEQ